MFQNEITRLTKIPAVAVVAVLVLVEVAVKL